VTGWPRLSTVVRVTSPVMQHADDEDPVQPPGDHSDRAHMARAIAVAEGGRRRSSPNPAVGCVLVRDGEVVAEAATDVPGGPHAEAAALAGAGARARGATAYVTLEPCSHHGRTPPCAPALLAAGVARVVYALGDPNPAAAGGAALLRGAGVEVEGGLLADWVALQLEGFTTLVTRGRPHVTLKLAQGVDGRLDSGDPARRWLTGPGARRAVHRRRAAVDAVLVGSGTVVADDPRLDVRTVAAPAGQPRPVVLDGRLRTPATANLARTGAIVVTTADADPAARRALVRAGVEVVVSERDGAGHLEPAAALRRLGALGISSVLAEPGRTLARALLAAGVVDRVVLHVATDLGEGPLVPAVEIPGWRTDRLGGAGGDVIVELVPPAAPSPPAGASAAVPVHATQEP
jgi:diaminohydroxyphosphoribosylaminopyrimidine deaminase / 5-amino-6-(5-phosphoribosylamino)uracil reductase